MLQNLAEYALLLVGWYLFVAGDPASGFAFGLLMLVVVLAAETVVVQNRWGRVVVEQPLGAGASAGHAL